jgi:peptidoglycan/LPS O-acetylase OafA/YrhL
MTTIKYRADIDGLRAVAVLAVIAFHACPAYLPGGFIGVDMFFVISGYLISGIIYKAQREGTFSYADFYARRVRRIFPALLAAVVLCLAYGWLVLLPAEYEQLGGHVAAGTVFLQNVAFWNESGYFDTSASLKPLLHLWSLAVEEQIYLVFPPLVLFALWMRWPMVLVLAVLLIASFAANLFMAGRSVSADFFLTPFRAWEFLAGAILAWIHDRRGQSSERSWLGEAASWAGVLLLAAGMAWITDREPYPGWRAVVPVVGTLLVIAAGRSASFNRWALSLAPVVWVGLISYPLYLFHWPLISFVHIIKGATPDPKLIAAAVALSFVLAVVTYYCLERQLRHSRSRWTVPLLLIGFLALGGLGAAIWKGKLPPKPPSREVQQVNQAIAEGQQQWALFSEGYRRTSKQGIGIWQIGGKGRQTLFFGDSTIMMLAPRIQKLLNSNVEDSRGATFIVGGGLCPVPGARRPSRLYHENLIPVFEEELQTNPAIDRVVISGLWKYLFSTGTGWSVSDVSMGTEAGRNKAFAALGQMIDRLVKSGKQVTVLLAVPQGPQLDPKNMFARSFLGGREVHVTPLPIDEFRTMAPGSHLDELAAVAKANGAEVIEPVAFLSRDGICISTDDNGPIRYDDLHLRAQYVRDQVMYLDATVADGATAIGDVIKSRKKAVEAPSASARPTQWKIAAMKGHDAVLTFPDTMPDAMRVEFGTLPTLEPWRVRLASQPTQVKADAKYRVSFRIRADKPREVIFTVREAQEPWTNLGLYGRIPVTDQWQSVTREFTAKADASNALFSFDLGGSDIAVEVAELSFRLADSHAADEMPAAR